MDNKITSTELLASEQRSHMNVSYDTTKYAISLSNVVCHCRSLSLGENVSYQKRVSLVCLLSWQQS